MGIYVFNKNALNDLLTADESRFDFGKEVIPAAIEESNVQAYLFNGYWEDIGTISAFYRANLDMTSVLPKFNLFDAKAPIYTRPRFLPGTKMRGCDIRDSIISEGGIINDATIEQSIIGIRCRIGGGSHIEHSLIMGADYYQTWGELDRDRRNNIPWIGIGEGTFIRNAIIDKNPRIGSNVRIVNEKEIQEYDGKDYYIRDGIVIIPKGTLIPDGTVI
jgi:glucose-1-phosphate adenylyltransferase